MADLRRIDGSHEQLSGEQVMQEVCDLLRERLPLVPLDDPFRSPLYAFALAGGVRISPVRVV